MSEIWCLPFVNELLVRISTGTNNYLLLRTRNRFSKRLLDLPENTNEVLLWRQIKRSEARVLHIFKNSNNNNMRSAMIYFKKEEDYCKASSSLLSYQKQNSSLEITIDYMLQLIRSLEEKNQHIE